MRVACFLMESFVVPASCVVSLLCFVPSVDNVLTKRASGTTTSASLGSRTVSLSSLVPALPRNLARNRVEFIAFCNIFRLSRRESVVVYIVLAAILNPFQKDRAWSSCNLQQPMPKKCCNLHDFGPDPGRIHCVVQHSAIESKKRCCKISARNRIEFIALCTILRFSGARQL